VKTITIKRGDSINRVFYAKNAEGAAQPLTGCEARIQVRSKIGAPPVISSTSNPANGITIDEENGVISWDVPYADTEGLNIQTYVFDVELTYSPTERHSSETVALKIGYDITGD